MNLKNKKISYILAILCVSIVSCGENGTDKTTTTGEAPVTKQLPPEKPELYGPPESSAGHQSESEKRKADESLKTKANSLYCKFVNCSNEDEGQLTKPDSTTLREKREGL